MKVCSVEGCGGTFKVTRDLCNKHYIRLLRHGSPLAGGTERGSTWDFLNSLIGHNGDDCVVWPFSRDGRGYARIREDGENIPAYRVMCKLAHGEPIAPRDHATHSCGKGHDGCVNPKHLEWGTRYKNQQDRVEHGTSNRGERCAAHKLKTDEVVDIFARLNAGDGIGDLACEYGVSYITIHDIKSGRSWAWLTGLQNPKERDKDGNLLAANDNTKPKEMAA